MCERERDRFEKTVRAEISFLAKNIKFAKHMEHIFCAIIGRFAYYCGVVAGNLELFLSEQFFYNLFNLTSLAPAKS